MSVLSVKPLFVVISGLSLFLALVLLFPSTLFLQPPISSGSTPSRQDIWSVRRIAEWRPCKWWLQGHLTHNCIGFFVEILQLFQLRVMGIFVWIAMVDSIK
ncbi:hypothetical protein SLEP1_g44041 [Rubroshorea leprosula]|uniref:Uncharacterized protein n=1 Tax=Rubroshorea leprosula TaxID=152421 RepID=A0AAV5LG41_9ROSI|nr:hypothetical protein SLEP1_g44041 [Rubroshorea leprosula]